MQLQDWLDENRVKKGTFAGSIGCVASRVSQLLRGGWPSQELAASIYVVTDGKVTPTDFLPPETFEDEDEPQVDGRADRQAEGTVG